MTHRADRSAPTTTRPTFRAGVATATGHRRSVNEDAYLAGPDFFVVADGMGGHRAGDVASRLAIDTFRNTHRTTSTIAEVVALVAIADDAIRRHGRGTARSGMGTTIVGATTIEHHRRHAVVIFHVGDARCYHLAGGALGLATHDHTHVQELIDAGLLDPADAPRHPLRNVVTRALGVELGAGPDLTVVDPPRGRLLLCSDGLPDELAPRTIGRVLSGIGDPQVAAERLVELALAGRARDNITALVVDLGSEHDGHGHPGDDAGTTASMTFAAPRSRETAPEQP